MSDPTSLMLYEIDARIEELQRLRATLVADFGEQPGKAVAPVSVAPAEPGAESKPLSEPSEQPAKPEPSKRSGRSKYAPAILAALANGPLTGPQIEQRLCVVSGQWWLAFKKNPWFEPTDATKLRGGTWQLSEAGRRALGESSASTAGSPT